MLALGLVLFVALVVVHEFGHFIMARRNGVDVEEFGVGLPPKAKRIYVDKKGTEYTLNWLPLGGFVRLKGEHDADTEKGTFGSVSFWAKTKIILAGVTMNLLTAWIMFSMLALVGIPRLPLPGDEKQFTVTSDTKIVSNKVFVGYVEKDGPADKAGLKTGDQITGIDTVSVCDTFNITDEGYDKLCNPLLAESQLLRQRTESLLQEGRSVIKVATDRGEFEVIPRTLSEVSESEKTDNPKGYIGIIPYDYTIQRSTWSAPIVGVGLVGQYSKLTYQALGGAVANLFSGHAKEAGENVSGPIGIFVVLKEGASFGPSYVLLIIALLSLTLAIMNTLPIPALDGGKLAVMVLFRLIKKPLTPKLEERIHGSGFLILMSLFVLITIVDIKRFF